MYHFSLDYHDAKIFSKGAIPDGVIETKINKTEIPPSSVDLC